MLELRRYLVPRVKACLRWIYVQLKLSLQSYGYTVDFRDPNLLKGFSFSKQTPSVYLCSVLNSLRPVDVGVPLVRIGGSSDGGYLLPDDFIDVSACLSAGCDQQWSFEKDLHTRTGISSHIVDSEDKRPSNLTFNHTYTAKWLDSKSKGSLISMSDWLDSLPLIHGDLLLQMDIEGSEWEVLGGLDQDFLKRFRIIVVEFHRIPNLFNFSILINHYEPLLNKLSQSFEVVHLHVNNSCGVTRYGEISIPNVFEVTYLRKDRVVDHVGYAVIPNPLDSLNDPSEPEILFQWGISTETE